MKIILLIGLPGSGKSTYGKDLGFLFLDDLMQNGGIAALREVDPTTETLIISDSGLIWPESRKTLERLIRQIILVTAPFEYVVWENDPVACYENIVLRNDGRIISKHALLQMSKTYVYPEGASSRPVTY
jgi:hypothetical protein